MTTRQLRAHLQNVRLPRGIDYKKVILVALPVIIFLFIVISIVRFLTSSANTPTTSTQLEKPLAVTQINKDFTFSLKDSTGKEVASFTYKLLNAELDRQIVVNGTRATAINGRVFLIVNLQLTNSQNQGIKVNTRDYMRLSVNGSTAELLAPEIHNDPVEVQAISTKFTRVGFPINTSDSKYLLKVGEISSNKTDIHLTFK